MDFWNFLGWKKFWFVLDGRLLTYYKSKADYESLSACCGCINLGIASTVRPIQIRGCKGYPLQIVTRSQIYYLRSQEKPVLEQWLIAIQEAASSPPSSSALTSWNSCSGSQYFKNSYASQSQWSLNNSSEDITDITERLGNLPDTFYQKRDRGSFTQAPPVIHKYHSFASLQSPVINNFGDQHTKKMILSSNENLRAFQEESRASQQGTMQHSTSLLVLDSSPQAAELRKELTRKLSIGSTPQNSTQEEDPAATPTPKFLLHSNKKKAEIGDDELHHYDEIGDFDGRHYENSNMESKSLVISKRSISLIRGDSVEKESNIYEHIETVDPGTSVWEPLHEGNVSNNSNKRLHHRISAGSNRNSLVSISELPEDISSASPSPFKSSHLKSIPETSWKSGVEPYKNYNKPHSEDDLSSCRSESFRSLPCVEKVSVKKKKGKALGVFLSKVFGKKGKGKSDSQENLQPMVISGPVDLRNIQTTQVPAFTDNFERKQPQAKLKQQEMPEMASHNVQNASNNNGQTGPTKSSQAMAGSRMTINNTTVMDELKQKVGHITLKRTNSNSNSSLESSPKENPPGKPVSRQNSNAEPRVPYVPRSKTAGQNKSSPVLIFQTQDKTFESSTDDDDQFSKDNDEETQVASICISPENEPSSLEADKLSQGEENQKVELRRSGVLVNLDNKLPGTSPSVPLNSPSLRNNDPDFKNKLAKFNRLSQSLSATFIAALNPTNTNTMGRSQSYKAHRSKAKRADDIIPPLPPKKKHTPGGSSGAISLYDVPLNNKPVSPSQESEHIRVEKSIAEYIRNLTKKNSTPDILLSGSGTSLKTSFRDVMSDGKEFHKALNASDEIIDVHHSSPQLPPPRPPKPKPPAKPKSLDFDLNRRKRNSGSSASSDTVVNTSRSSIASVSTNGLLELPKTNNSSPAASNKSLDIDTIDGLSDPELCDTKASNTPPDSPKICPIHPETAMHDDSALSSDARTPDSMISISERIVPDSLATTPDTEILLSSSVNPDQGLMGTDSDTEPISINKLEIVIRDNDGSPGLGQKSPDDNESRLDSLERITKNIAATDPPSVYQNIKFATVSTLIQEFETVEENEDEMSELYDDFPAEFYTPTPSSFSGYSPSEASTTSSDSSSMSTTPSSVKKHARIDSIRNSGMEQLEAFLSFGSNSSSDELSFESCTDNFPEDALKQQMNSSAIGHSLNNNHKGSALPQFPHGKPSAPGPLGPNRTGAISRLGHSSAVGHLQKILTSDVK